MLRAFSAKMSFLVAQAGSPEPFPKPESGGWLAFRQSIVTTPRTHWTRCHYGYIYMYISIYSRTSQVPSRTVGGRATMFACCILAILQHVGVLNALDDRSLARDENLWTSQIGPHRRTLETNRWQFETVAMAAQGRANCGNTTTLLYRFLSKPCSVRGRCALSKHLHQLLEVIVSERGFLAHLGVVCRGRTSITGQAATPKTNLN
jgi:hypothetical protein